MSDRNTNEYSELKNLINSIQGDIGDISTRIANLVNVVKTVNDKANYLRYSPEFVTLDINATNGLQQGVGGANYGIIKAIQSLQMLDNSIKATDHSFLMRSQMKKAKKEKAGNGNERG